MLAVLVASSVLPIAVAHLAHGCGAEDPAPPPDLAASLAPADEPLVPSVRSGPVLAPTTR